MNFFQSVFSEDPQPTDLKTHDHDSSSSSESPTQEIALVQHQSESDPDPSSTGHNNTWSFGGLMRTLTTKSESVIQTYKRDLEEFSTGLKNESVAIREVAKEIPVSIIAGASVAQGSLESVWRGTSEIISQGKHVLLPTDYGTNNSSNNNNNNNSNVRNSRTYGSRFEANVCAIQNDIDSYAEEVSDLDEFEKWKLGFDSQDRGEEIESLLDENNVMEGIYSKLVPSVIDSETFWARYFFRVYKLQQVEDARASLVKRAISVDDEEDLSWDVDDDDEGSNRSEPKGVDSLVAREDLEEKEIQRLPSENDVFENKNVEELQVENSGVVGSKSENEAPVVVEVENEEKSGTESDEKVTVEGTNEEKSGTESAKTSGRENDNKSGTKSDEKVIVEVENEEKSGTESEEKVTVEGTNESAKTSGCENDNKSGTKSDEKVKGTNESAKSSDLSGVSGQVVVSEEEDLSWDEIEDVGSGDEKKPTSSGSPNRAELRKRLSTADEDEDLSWDIE